MTIDSTNVLVPAKGPKNTLLPSATQRDNSVSWSELNGAVAELRSYRELLTS